MDSDRPYITKRPHKKSRNGCIQCKQRKQKCDESQPTCGSCKKRKVQCQWPLRPALDTNVPLSESNSTLARVEKEELSENKLAPVRSSSSSESSDSEQFPQRTNSTAGSVTSIEEVPRNDLSPQIESFFAHDEIPNSLQLKPWRNVLEHSLYDAYVSNFRQGLVKPGVDDATREIWLNLIPRIAVTTDRTLFKLVISLGSLHSAVKTSDYPRIEPGSEGAKLWNISNRYFSDAISSFRDSITSRKMYETNPEVFCVIALVLSFRSSMTATHLHTDVYSLYDDTLSWFSASLGYIALGGFYTKRLENTQLGEIMRANPGATYHFHPFLDYIRTQDFPHFDYLHPLKDPVSGNLDPEDSTDEALNAYTLTLKLVGWVYKAAIDGALVSHLYGMYQTVPYTVPHHFLLLLRQKRPRAIAVLAHHTALAAFFGVHEGLHFWPREHVLLLQTLTPPHWSWAFQKAIEVVNEGEALRSGKEKMILPVQRRATTLLNAVA